MQREPSQRGSWVRLCRGHWLQLAASCPRGARLLYNCTVDGRRSAAQLLMQSACHLRRKNRCGPRGRNVCEELQPQLHRRCGFCRGMSSKSRGDYRVCEACDGLPSHGTGLKSDDRGGGIRDGCKRRGSGWWRRRRRGWWRRVGWHRGWRRRERQAGLISKCKVYARRRAADECTQHEASYGKQTAWHPPAPPLLALRCWQLMCRLRGAQVAEDVATCTCANGCRPHGVSRPRDGSDDVAQRASECALRTARCPQRTCSSTIAQRRPRCTLLRRA